LLDPKKDFYTSAGRKKYIYRTTKSSDLRVDFLGTGAIAYLRKK